jgi:polyisoprenoid-binding protein YceI/cytochrome c553
VTALSWWAMPVVLAGASAWAQGDTYTVDRTQAEVRFRVDAPLDDIVGVSESLSGSIRYDAATGTGTGKLTADLATFRTGISLRDEDLRNEFFQASRFPIAVFTVQRMERTQPAKVPGDVEQAQAFGTLSLHGVEHVVRIPLKLQHLELVDRSVIQALGTLTVKFADYQIQRPTALFLKLGDTANVEVRMTLEGPAHPPAAVAAGQTPPPAPASPPAVAAIFKRAGAVPVAKAPRKVVKPKPRFSPGSPEGRGEKLFTDASVGGTGNALSCASCHGVRDERGGIVDASGFIHPSHSLYDSAKRPSLWQGIAATPGKAGALCTRLFLLNQAGLTEAQQADVEAFLQANSPDAAVPGIDYRTLALTRRSELAKPVGGDAKAGAKLEKKYCESCHAKGSVRPPLTPGLYEPDYLVRRVRWLAGHDDRQMPPLPADRLTDGDLRDIVTYLSGAQAKRIFDRQHHAAPAAPAGEP